MGRARHASTRSRPMTGGPARSRRTLPFLLGIALLAAAAWSLARHGAALDAAMQSLRHPSPLWLSGLPIAIALHVLLTASVLRLLLNRTIRVGSVGTGECLALTLTSMLGNLTPTQAGLAGRVAYQHRVHGVPITVSVLLVVQGTLLTIGAGVWIGLTLVVLRSAGLSWLAAPASLALLMPAAIDSGRPRSVLVRAFALRCLEVLLAGLRVHASLALIGCETDPAVSLALGTASNLCNAIPVLGSAIGVREWVTALLAPSLAGIATPDVLAAQLLDRAVEISIVLAGSAVAVPSLARRLAAAPTVHPSSPMPDFTATVHAAWTGARQPGGDAASLPNADPPPRS